MCFQAIEDFLYPRVKTTRQERHRQLQQQASPSQRARHTSAPSDVGRHKSRFGMPDDEEEEEAMDSYFEGEGNEDEYHEEEPELEEDEDEDEDRQDMRKRATCCQMLTVHARCSCLLPMLVSVRLHFVRSPLPHTALLPLLAGRRHGKNAYEVQLSTTPGEWWTETVTSSPGRTRLTLTINGQPLLSHMSIYQAVHLHARAKEDGDAATAAAAVPSRYSLAQLLGVGDELTHVIEYSIPVVSRARPQSARSGKQPEQQSHPFELLDIVSAAKVPSLVDSPILPLLRLLRVLNILNTSRGPLLDITNSPELVADRSFINHRVAAKLIREVSNFSAISKAAYPDWCGALVTSCPFLLPFNQRHRYFRYTAFGAARALQYYREEVQGQGARQEEQGETFRLARTKVRVPRARPLEAAHHIMHKFAHLRTVMEVEYFGEVGTGLGPTMELYSLVSKAFLSKEHTLWRMASTTPEHEYVYAPQGVFPCPSTSCSAKTLALFHLLGMVVAKSIQDDRVMDVHFNPVFYRRVLGMPVGAFQDLATVDSVLHASLSKLHAMLGQREAILRDDSLSSEGKAAEEAKLAAAVDNLYLDFTLPGYEVALVAGGEDKAVTLDNLKEYIDVRAGGLATLVCWLA